MRDAAGQLADRLHLLGLAQLFLQPAALTHILGKQLVTFNAAVLIAHRATIQTDRDGLPVLAPPHRLRFHGARGVVHLREVAGARRRLLEHIAVEIAAQQLRFRLVAEHLDQSGIHREEGPVGRRAQDAERGLMDEHAAGFVRAPQRLLGAAALGDIRRHTDDAGDAAVALAHRRVLRLELEPEQLHPRRHLLSLERPADIGHRLRHVAQQLEERFAEQHPRPHAERVQALALRQCEDTLGVERKQNDG